MIFTCLSSDIIAHEVTHALVHRLRRHFSVATNPDAGEKPQRVFSNLNLWARRHAVAIGLEPSKPVHLESVHVAYRQAEDCQPRPEIVVQFTQRRPDLEEIEQPPCRPRRARHCSRVPR